MPRGLKHFQQTGQLHFITFSCYKRAALLREPEARNLFEEDLERVRQWYEFYITGYVVMPEHVHLLISEPERGDIALCLQMLKQNVAQKLKVERDKPFWYRRYYDFNVWSERKMVEKLRYMHAIPSLEGSWPAPRTGLEQFPPLPDRRERYG